MVSQARIRAPTVLVNLLLKTSLGGARRQVAEAHAADAPQTKRRQEKLRAKSASVLRRRPVHLRRDALVPQDVRMRHRAQ